MKYIEWAIKEVKRKEKEKLQVLYSSTQVIAMLSAINKEYEKKIGKDYILKDKIKKILEE